MTIQYLNNGFAGGVKLVTLAAHREVEDRQFGVVNPYAGSGMMPPDRYDAARNVRIAIEEGALRSSRDRR